MNDGFIEIWRKVAWHISESSPEFVWRDWWGRGAIMITRF
jgi:hypothetical protein